MLDVFGMSLVVIAWIEQVWRSWIKRHLSFSPFFLSLFLIGMGILAYDRLNQIDTVMGALYAVTAVLAFIALIVLIVRRRKPGAF